jgi:hypothetical protein
MPELLTTHRAAPSVVHSAPMSSAPVAVVDALNSLLEAQQNSIIRFMGEGSPYLSRASAEVRRPLAEMLQNNLCRRRELHDTIEYLGGTPVPARVQPEEQYLAFLSLKFLLPKLVDAKRLVIQRYENAERAVGRDSPEADALLRRHLAEHRAELAVLEKAAADVIATK